MSQADSKIALKYATVVSSLIERINKGEFAPAYMLPPENKLIEQYGVSRITIRRALDELEMQNYIYRKQGKGTFINRIRVDKDLNRQWTEGLTTMIQNTGKKCERIQIEKIIRPAAETAHYLELSPDTPTLFYRRIYLADGAPVYYSESTINHLAFPGLENYDYNFLSLSHVVREVFNAQIYRYNKEIGSTKAGRAAQYLEVQEDHPILYLSHVSFLHNGVEMVPFERAESFMRTDIVAFDPRIIL